MNRKNFILYTLGAICAAAFGIKRPPSKCTDNHATTFFKNTATGCRWSGLVVDANGKPIRPGQLSPEEEARLVDFAVNRMNYMKCRAGAKAFFA